MKYLIIIAVFALPTATADRRIGSAQFHIERVKDEVVMEPLVPARFKLVQLKGEHAEPNDIVRCEVFARALDGNPELMITVLKCGDREYGVQEVDFAYSK